MFEKLEKFSLPFMIIGGDFNLTISPGTDKQVLFSSSPATRVHHLSTTFHRIMRAHNVLEIWRIKHPVHRLYSRLDNFLITSPLLTSTVASEINLITWSDHSSVQLDISFYFSSPQTCHWPLDYTFLYIPDICDQLSRDLTEFFYINESSVSNASTLWGVHKSYFQGQCISVGSRLKKTAFQRSFLLSFSFYLLSKLGKAEKLLLSSPTVARLCMVTSLRNQLKSIDLNKVAKSLLWAKQKFYEYSNKPHRMLVNRLKPHPFHSCPDFLMQSNGSPTYCVPCPKSFQDLYNCLNF